MRNSTQLLGKLSEAQLKHYNDHGFVAPIDILSEAEAAQCLKELEDAEKGWPDALSGPGRNNAHYVLPILDKLTHNNAILNAVESLIGSNILVCGTTLFIKEPENEGFISWHQDARYIGLEPHNWVTAWLALSPATTQNGCMRMMPGSHKGELLAHEDTYGKNNLLTRGQTVPNVDESRTVPVELQPGQLSLHHPRVVHGSGPNLSQSRRVGFAIQSYIGADVDQVIGSIFVQQARGEDPFGYHQQRPRISTAMQDSDIAFREQANNELSKIFYAGAEQKGRF